jgi:selenocysteine-specific elongation factor
LECGDSSPLSSHSGDESPHSTIDMLVETPHAIIGTAGHIDHGKTALVKALTGMDVDTLAEEKRRGITIELGFAFLTVPQTDRLIIFIDVPGHEKLVKTMVAGASNLDAAMLVVAADEGVNVQTIEHFEILQLFGIPAGLIALTKADLVDQHRIDQVTQDLHDLTAGTFLESAPIVPVSSITGAGIDDLKAALGDVARNVRPRNDSGVFRMPIDRVFTMHGFGTVIAGTILSGTARVGDRLEILPDGIQTKIRGIQVHAKSKDEAIIGTRTAVNLQDVKKEDLRRGQCACAVGSVTPTTRLDAKLHVLKSVGEDLKNRQRVRFHVGSDEVMSRVVLLGNDKLGPGQDAPAQFVLESPTVTVAGDRFVIRSFSTMRTIGGGVVLDAHAEPHKRSDLRVVESLEKLEAGAVEAVEHSLEKSGTTLTTVGELAGAVGRSEDDAADAVRQLVEDGLAVEIGDKYLHRSAYDKLVSQFTGIITDYYAKNPYCVFMPSADLQSRFAKLAQRPVYEAILGDLNGQGKLVIREKKIGLAGREPQWRTGERDLAARIERIYDETKYATPPEDELMAELRVGQSFFNNVMASLMDMGKLVRLAERVTYHQKHLKTATEVIVNHIKQNGGITAAELRDKMGVSRKYAIALLEYLDTNQITKRLGDKRVLARGNREQGVGNRRDKNG